MKMKLLCLTLGLAMLCGCADKTNSSGGPAESSANNSANASAANSQNFSAEISQSKTSADSSAPEKTDSKILIAYFAVSENSDVDASASASVSDINGVTKGRIEALAEMIQNGTGGDLFSIKTSVKYPGDIEKLIDFASEEQSKNARPELTNHIENLDKYDTIFVGYPTWWYDLPQVMYSFFDEYDLSGKKIIPFNSANGSRFSGTIGTIKELEPNADVAENGLSVHERDIPNAADDVANWLKELGY